MTPRLPLLATVLAASLLTSLGPATAEAVAFPDRAAPRPETTNGVPHVQLGLAPVPAVVNTLLAHVAGFPDVALGRTRVSLPGAVGFQLAAGVELAREDAIIRGREFAHMHPDGSLHASLGPQVAQSAIEAGWATPHPWAGTRPGWDDFVMIYTPRTDQELAVVKSLVEMSYEYVTGRPLP